MTVLLKALGPNRECVYGGQGTWPDPGTWTSPVEPVAGGQGWHICTPDQMLDWLPGTNCGLWQVEAAGRVASCVNKHAVEQARLIRPLEWTNRTARLFAADCAEAVLAIYEAPPTEPRPEWISEGPKDHRLRVAIEVARRYAHGEVGDDELHQAEQAAWEAVYSSLEQRRHAAEAAAWAAHTGRRSHIGPPRAPAHHAAAKAIEAGADRDHLGRLLVKNIDPVDRQLAGSEPSHGDPAIGLPVAATIAR